MNVAKETAKSVGIAIAVVITFLLIVVATVGIGYLLGMLLAILPFVSGWLTEGLSIEKSQIPSITAWFAVGSLFIGGVSTQNTGNDKE